MASPPDPKWSRLLGLAVHELRTPISVGSGYLRMLLASPDGNLSDRQRQFVSESQKAWGRMTVLAEEMSELSRLEGGTFRLDTKPVDVRQVLEEAIGALPPTDETAVTTELAPGKGRAMVQGDPVRLRTAFTSLLLALRRELVSSARLVVQEGPRTHDGRGVSWIAIGDAEQVGGFSTADPRALGTFDEWRGGSGLKLAIARRIIDAHGGAVWSPGDGARAGAVVALPLAEGAGQAPRSATGAAPDTAGKSPAT